MSKPAIRNAARDCACSIGDAFAAFFPLYSWLDEQTADGVLYSDPQEIDAISRLSGFAASLSRSGWLTFYGDKLVVTNWDEHNGQNAKRRAINAKQMARARDEKRKQGLPVRPCPMPKMPSR